MFTLREYQGNSLESLRAGFRLGLKTQILYMPTGGGKTESAISLLVAAAEKGKRAAMILDRRILVDQTSARLDKYRIEHGVLMAKHWRWRPQEKIQICSAQTLEKCESFPEFDLIIIDECFPSEVEILTDKGFVRFDELDKSHLCAQYDDGDISFVEPTEYINKPYCGQLINLKSSKRYDISMTPGHELLLCSGAGIWKKVAVAQAKLGGANKMVGGGLAVGEDYGLSSMERLMIAYQADGSLHNTTESGCTMSFSFTKKRKIDRFLSIINESELRFSEVKCSITRGRRFMVYGISVASKIISDTFNLATMSAIKAKSIIDEMVEWDGHKHSKTSWYYSSIIKKNADFYQAVAILAGYRTNIVIQKDNRKDTFKDVYRLFIIKNTCMISTQNIHKTITEYVGNVHCVRVPSGNIIVRKNGKVLVTGNCHTVRKQVSDFIKNTGIRTVGLSASPFTKGLGKLYQDVVCNITTSQLVDSGSLVPLKVFVAKEIDMTGAKKVAGEWAQNEVTERGIKITGDIVSEWVKKTHKFFDKPEKTIVFCAGVAHGADLQNRFNESGYNFISISYKDDDEYKQEVIKEFSKPDSTITGLIATDILTKGFDVADVKIGISARPFSKSFSSHVQQMGRVMRPCNGKEYALWLDHSSNYLRFKDDWDDLFINGVSELDDGKEKPKKEPSDKEKEAAKCPKCSALWPPKSDTCSHCGHVRERRNEVQVKSGELVEVGATTKNEKFEAAYKESFYQQLLKYAKDRGYKDGWAFHFYTRHFNVQPKWRKVSADFVSKDILNLITHYNIKRAYRKKE